MSPPLRRPARSPIALTSALSSALLLCGCQAKLVGLTGDQDEPATTTVTDARATDSVSGAIKSPVFLTQPLSRAIAIGTSTLLSAVATGAGTLSYQWFEGESGDTARPIGGATNASFTSAPLSVASAFWVRVSNAYGSLDSATAHITIVNLTLGVSQASLSATAGNAIAAVTATPSSGNVSGCAIWPNLVAETGLSFDSSNCTVSGTPTHAIANRVYTVTATVGTLFPTAQITITVVPGAAARLKFVAQPGSAQSTASLGTVKVQIEDANQNLVPTDSSTQVVLSIAVNPGAGTLAGTATATAANGVATFTNLSINKAGTGYALLAARSGGGFTTSQSAPFNITPGPPTQIEISSGGSLPVNVCTGPVRVRLKDASGNFGAASSAPSAAWAIPLLMTGSLKTHSAADCSDTPITSVLVAGNGSDSADFYLKNTVVESATLVADATGYALGTAMALFDSQVANPFATAAGDSHHCAIVSGGVKCWGANSVGQLGNNSTSPSAVPVQTIPANSFVTMIRSGGYHALHTCAVVAGGVRCWGANESGQIGNGTTHYQTLPPLTPTEVIPAASSVTAVAVGASHTCAIQGGALFCWGDNSSGQFGNGTTTPSTTPVMISNVTSPTAITAGDSYTCAVVSGGVKCWGANNNSTLGNGGTTPSLVPVDTIAAGSGVTAIDSGGNSTCAIVSGGVKCWGYNFSGQLGIGSAAPQTTPQQTIAAGSGVTAIGVAPNHACAIISGGIWCWGANPGGQLGNQVYSMQTSPVQVLAAGSGATAIDGSYLATCAVIAGGVKCFGDNSNGELGGSSSSTPANWMDAILSGGGAGI